MLVQSSNIKSTQNSHTFDIDLDIQALSVDFSVIVLTVEENWGGGGGIQLSFVVCAS